MRTGSGEDLETQTSQSDIDVTVIGRGRDPPLGVEAALTVLAEAFAGVYEVEVHRCSLSKVTIEKKRAFDSRWIQFGLHGFDLKQNHLVCAGSDQFADLIIPGGDELRALAVGRVRSLFEMVCRLRDPQQMYKWACEVLKATQLYFATLAGKEPTRDKRYVLDNFAAHVPEFAEKNIADSIWQHYREGKRRTDAEYLDLCDRFVRGARGVLA